MHVLRQLEKTIFRPANDAVSLGLAVGALAVAAVCASLIPAARATGVQPVEVLREE
jgi:ABC-type lipoprotein release transport system permease subunit